MFNKQPERFFPYAQIEVVYFHDEVGDRFTEKIFKGPLHIQLGDALGYIKSQFLQEEVKKIPGEAKAMRFYNYPYSGIEEALANAVYHRDYEKREPIEVRITSSKIEILSFPGPIPPITRDSLNKGIISAREYRNRRVGDFLKELHLTEGRWTGLLKIQNAMKNNGSPPAIFDTDEERSYFLTTLPIHPELLQQTSRLDTKTDRLADQTGRFDNETDRLADQTGRFDNETDRLADQTGRFDNETDRLADQTGRFSLENLPIEMEKKIHDLGRRPSSIKLKQIIQELCRWQPLSAQQLTDILKRKDKKYLVDKYLTPMLQESLLNYLYPNNPDHPNQAYYYSK